MQKPKIFGGGKTIVFQLEDRCFEQQQPAAGQQCKNQKYLEGVKQLSSSWKTDVSNSSRQCKNQKYLEEEEEKVGKVIINKVGQYEKFNIQTIKSIIIIKYNYKTIHKIKQPYNEFLLYRLNYTYFVLH